MKDPKSEFHRLSALDTLSGYDTGEAVNQLGLLIDLAGDFKNIEATKLAIKLGDEVRIRTLASTDAALLEYFVSNAWANLDLFETSTIEDRWKWENRSIEKQIIHLRQAIQCDGFNELHSIRQSQILTNLGNLLNTVGRFVEAIELWNRALLITPQFAMARGNRGYGLVHYSSQLYDQGHKVIFLRHAYVDLCSAIQSEPNTSGEPDPPARECFNKYKARIEAVLPSENLNKGTDLPEFSLGDSDVEVKYRKWCLNKCLFVNPLNDLGSCSIAGNDCLMTPSMVTDANAGTHFQGFFNQLKQEFVSARYLCFEGATSTTPHFSDKGVLLFNTLDYPSYSLAVEKIKLAFRMAYSLMDKIAFFLNHYLAFGILENQVSFRSFWYEQQNRKKGLRSEFQQRANWPLRGLFWLSKDLFEHSPDFRECLEPDAQKLNTLRNHAEHKYLKLHEMCLPAAKSETGNRDRFRDELAFSLLRSDFVSKTERLLVMARASLVYLSLAIHVEEQQRSQSRPEGLVLPLDLGTLNDEWKI